MAGCRAATRWAAADVLRVVMRLGGWQTLFHDGDEKPWFIDRNDHKQLALGVRYHPPSHPRTQPSTRPPTYHRPLIATAVLSKGLTLLPLPCYRFQTTTVGDVVGFRWLKGAR